MLNFDQVAMWEKQLKSLSVSICDVKSGSDIRASQ